MSQPREVLPTVIDQSRMAPIAFERPGRLQADCERLEAVATEAELPRLQAIYELDSYARLSLDQLLLMRELGLRVEKLVKG